LSTSDIEINNSDIPFLAEFIYKIYPYDALNFEIDAIQKMIEFLPQLYPDVEPPQREKMIQILRLQTAIKFCQYAENLAVIAIAFQFSYDDGKKEMLGIFSKISRYSLGEINDFYNNIKNRENHYFAKFYGYPPLQLQNPATRHFLELSCRNIKDALIEVAEMYSQLRDLYNAYKHGYRILFGKDSYSSADIFPFVTDQGKQKYTRIDGAKLKRILTLSLQCRRILESIFKQHHIRVQYEKTGGKENAIKVDFFLRKNDNRPSQEEQRLTYPSRGDRMKSEKVEGDKIYNLFREQLEKHDRGKIVAIDIDSKKIISKDYDKSKVLSDIRSIQSSARIYIRRVSQDGNVGFGIY
jgi:hypothetical protein